MTWLYLLPAGFLLLLLAFVAGAIGQRHQTEKSMSLLQDVEGVLAAVEAKVDAAVESAVKPLHDEIASLTSDNAALLAKLEAFGESVVSKIAAGAAPAPAA